MGNTVFQREPKTTNNNANRSAYYMVLTVAIIIGMVGVFIRFVPDVITSLDQYASLFSWIANIAVAIAAVIAFRIVFNILGFGKSSA